VAQVSNLPYGRLPVGRLCLPGRFCGWEIRDTAALQQVGNLRYAIQLANPLKYPADLWCGPAPKIPYSP
jgi:hypothetical protein